VRAFFKLPSLKNRHESYVVKVNWVYGSILLSSDCWQHVSSVYKLGLYGVCLKNITIMIISFSGFSGERLSLYRFLIILPFFERIYLIILWLNGAVDLVLPCITFLE
jgi:hypothetical protein